MTLSDIAIGSFATVVAANRLVNSTLSRNHDVVALVARGVRPREFVTATFSSPTGVEAFRRGPFAQPYLRNTYGVWRCNTCMILPPQEVFAYSLPIREMIEMNTTIPKAFRRMALMMHQDIDAELVNPGPDELFDYIIAGSSVEDRSDAADFVDHLLHSGMSKRVTCDDVGQGWCGLAYFRETDRHVSNCTSRQVARICV